MIVIAVAPMVPIIVCMVVTIGFMFALIKTFVISVVPSMFRAIVGVHMPVINVVPTKHAPWVLGDLIPNGGMTSQEVSYFIVLIKIIAVVN